MKYSRRKVVTTLAAGILGTTFDLHPACSGIPLEAARTADLVRPPDGYPLRERVVEFQERASGISLAARASGLKREDYLRLAGGIVRFFAAHQDGRGAIIDPYSHLGDPHSR